MMCLDTFRQRQNELVKERAISASSRVASDGMFTQHCNKLIVTVQIENAPGGKGIQLKTKLPKNTTELERSRSSLNRNFFVLLTKYHHVTQRNAQKSRSVPLILVVFSVTPFKIDQNKNQNRSMYEVQILRKERR